jgi:hypothetical protein
MFGCLILFMYDGGIHHAGRYVANANFVVIFCHVIKPFKCGLFQSQHSCYPVVFQVGVQLMCKLLHFKSVNYWQYNINVVN